MVNYERVWLVGMECELLLHSRFRVFEVHYRET